MKDAAGREPKHIVLNGAINKLQCTVGLAENLLHEITPLRPVDPGEAPGKGAVEAVPSFQEIYDNAPHRIVNQADKLRGIIAELREILL